MLRKWTFASSWSIESDTIGTEEYRKMIYKLNDMNKKIEVYFGRGMNKIEIELTEEQVAKVKRLQKHIRLKREEEKLAKKEGRSPRSIPY